MIKLSKRSKDKKNTISEEEMYKIILRHRLVPKHEIVDEEEKKRIIEKYAGGDPYKLPYILASDPVVKAIGAKPGDVIKITRRSPTAGVTIYYRYVVK